MGAIEKNNSRGQSNCALLDQKIVVRLGNIYVDEVLFKSGIHPETKANQLSLKSCKVLQQTDHRYACVDV